MFPVLRNTLCHLYQIANKQIQTVSFHSVLSKTPILPNQSSFLAPVQFNLVPNCGFKMRGWLRRRCKDCYFVRRQERLFVICKTHPRHKQMSMVKDPRNTWILSHATQSKVRPW